MLSRLRAKFVCVIMAVVTLLLCILLGLVVYFMGEGLEYQSVRAMQALAQDPGPMGPDREPPENIHLPYISVLMGHRGQVDRVQGSDGLMDEDTAVRAARKALERREQTGILKEENLRYYKSMRPGGQLVLLTDMSSERSTMTSLIRSCILVGILVFFAFLGLSIVLVRWMVRPVEQAWLQQKQFVADASHELKTPLTVIMTNAELLQEEKYSQEQQRQFSGSILTMTLQMRRLVEGLLELARVDNGSVSTCFGIVDFSSLVAGSALPFEPLYFERGLTLQTWTEPGIFLQGSEQHLSQTLDILLDNAMKYSTVPGTVELRLRRQGGQCLLSVANPGRPLSREERKDIFKRFYRVDKARSRDGSYGLGLSIAHRIVQEHRGRIWAESGDGVNTFFVQLPASLRLGEHRNNQDGP